jgi:hypothetical protein
MAGDPYSWTTSATNIYTTIGTTSTAYPIQWNGQNVRVVPTPTPTISSEEGPLDWLRRRVEEVRVDLAEAA